MEAPLRNHAITLASGRMELADGPRLGSPMTEKTFFFARCCLGKVPGGAPFSQLHKGDGKIARTGQIMQIYNKNIQTN